MDVQFPTSKQRAFVQGVNDFCQEKYGFPVHMTFSLKPHFQKTIYMVMVCPQYSIWTFTKTQINKFYVYVGTSQKKAHRIADNYKNNGYDVYINDYLRFWNAVPEVSMVITPDFFRTPDLYYPKNKADKLQMLELLIHESFHQYVHQSDIGLKTYGKYITMDKMIEEEVVAHILGRLGIVEYLIEKDPGNSKLDQAKEDLKNLFGYWFMEDRYQTLKKIYEDKSLTILDKEAEKQIVLKNYHLPDDKTNSPNNAFFLRSYIYYGNSHMKKYYPKLVKNNKSKIKTKLIVQQFIENYWSKFSDK
ncbi:hypothetical protein IID20_02990 [Patescibacteria group bacterium]|nr:hypothetical protein [Patescibacteria group bacterium]